MRVARTRPSPRSSGPSSRTRGRSSANQGSSRLPPNTRRYGTRVTAPTRPKGPERRRFDFNDRPFSFGARGFSALTEDEPANVGKKHEKSFAKAKSGDVEMTVPYATAQGAQASVSKAKIAYKNERLALALELLRAKVSPFSQRLDPFYLSASTSYGRYKATGEFSPLGISSAFLLSPYFKGILTRTNDDGSEQSLATSWPIYNYVRAKDKDSSPGKTPALEAPPVAVAAFDHAIDEESPAPPPRLRPAELKAAEMLETIAKMEQHPDYDPMARS